MIRMAHKIGTVVGFSGTLGDDAAHTASLGVQTAKKGPSIIADSISRFMEQHEKKVWDLTVDFPCVAPPLESFVVEWVTEDGLPVAVCISSADAKVFDAAAPYRKELVAQSRWVLFMSYWDSPQFKPFCGQTRMLPVSGLLFVRESGQPIALEEFPFTPALADAIKKIAFHMSCVAALTISFMHCKNVSVLDVTKDAGPTEKWMRRQKSPRIEYKVLDIVPMSQTLRTEGGLEGNGLKKALHICRGHFANYTDEHPLFGKYTGRFWKPSHVRGDIKQGAVVKDYAVKP